MLPRSLSVKTTWWRKENKVLQNPVKTIKQFKGDDWVKQLPRSRNIPEGLINQWKTKTAVRRCSSK